MNNLPPLYPFMPSSDAVGTYTPEKKDDSTEAKSEPKQYPSEAPSLVKQGNYK